MNPLNLSSFEFFIQKANRYWETASWHCVKYKRDKLCSGYEEKIVATKKQQMKEIVSDINKSTLDLSLLLKETEL